MSFRLHPPAGELKFWSALWLVFGVVGSIYYPLAGHPAFLLVTLPVLFLTLGIWLRIKVCGQMLGGLLVVGCLLALPLVFRSGFEWHRVFRTCLTAYFASLVFKWVKSVEEEGDKPLLP